MRGGLIEPESFEYDGFHRLTDWGFFGAASGSTDRDRTWLHDSADNVSDFFDSVIGSGQPSITNLLNQYDDFSPSVSLFTHTTTGEESSRTSSAGDLSWTWDALGRPTMLQLTSGANTTVIAWVIDAFDRPFARTDSTGNVDVYNHVGGDILEINDVFGNDQEFVYGVGGELIWRRRGDLGESLSVHVGAFGNVQGYHDGSSVVEEYHYTPYGELWNPASPGSPVTSAIDNQLYFLTKVRDPITGHQRLGARHYDPALGRFASRDPLEEAADLNLYSYARQNPFRWADPTGLAPQDGQDPVDGSGGADPSNGGGGSSSPEPDPGNSDFKAFGGLSELLNTYIQYSLVAGIAEEYGLEGLAESLGLDGDSTFEGLWLHPDKQQALVDAVAQSLKDFAKNPDNNAAQIASLNFTIDKLEELSNDMCSRSTFTTW